MIVAIPSKARLNYTAGKFFNKYHLFVEPQDYEKYKALGTENIELINIGQNDLGFGYLLRFIVDYTLSIGEKYFLFCDDDIWGFVRKDKKPFDSEEFLAYMIKTAEENNYAQLGVCFQGHGFYYKKDIIESKAVWGCGLYNAEAIKKVGNYDKKIIIFNDYEITARLLLHKYKVAITTVYQFQHKMKSQEGGAMFLYKKPELIKRQCAILKKRYGDYCRIIYNEKHGIFEVRFNWAKLKKQY